MSDPKQEGMFNDEIELEMFDMVANDLPHLVQVHGKLWKRRTGAGVDPVHSDLTTEKYRGPFDVILSAPDSLSRMLAVDSTTGLEATREGEIWITRKECERIGFGFPQTGDVVSFLLERLPDAYYFYINNVHQEGRLPQGRAFVMFKLELRYMSKRSPEDVVEDGETCYNGRRID